MFEKLDRMMDRFQELNEEITHPEIICDYPKYQSILKEISTLSPAVQAYLEYRKVEKHLLETEDLLADPLLASEAEAEMEMLIAEKEDLLRNLRLMLIPPDPMDSRNVILEIRAGVGGEEAALFASDLMRMYLKYADRSQLTASVLSVSDTDLGGISEALLMITGPDSFARFKYESGVHCVKRVPVTESGGRIHTSTATVAVMPEAQEIELEILPADLKIDVFHASGHGGQGVNTTDSAVRITHIPSGMVVTCQDERSQLENKAKALKVLRSRLLDQTRLQQEQAYADDRRSQIGAGDRSERIRTYYYNHDFVVDHRIGLTVNRTTSVLNGDLDPFTDALRLAEKTEKLNSLRRK